MAHRQITFRRFKVLTLPIIAALAAPTLGCQVLPDKDGDAEARAYQKHVETHPSQGPVRTIDGAMAQLVTTKEGASVSFTTQELMPGNVYTLWWVVINNPDACAKSPCGPPDVLKNTAATNADVAYGDGIIAGADGKGRFTSFLKAGDMPRSWFGIGYRNAMGAEIHFVINDHGPLVPQLAQSMLHSYRGGCMDEGLPPPFPDTAKNDGAPGPNKCALVQDAIFQQN